MGGRAGHQRARVRAATCSHATGLHTTRVLATCCSGRTFHARTQLDARGGAFMDAGARRALVDSESRSVCVEPGTRRSADGASAGVDARR